MAAEIREITESNPNTTEDILAEILRLVRKHDELLESFRPLIDKYVSNPATRWRERLGKQG